MKYKVLLFDADETLFNFKKSEEFALCEALKSIDVNYIKEFHLIRYKEINTRIWKELELGKITLKELKTERFIRYFNAIGITFDPLEFTDIYMTFLSQGSFLFDGAKDMIHRLNEKATLAIITNGLSKVQNQRIKKSVIAHYFKEIIISEEVGIVKPDPQIFELTMDKLGDFKKSEILMIGDNLSSDILGGINFGIDTCWYNPNKKNAHKDIIATHEVSSLEKLEELILNF